VSRKTFGPKREEVKGEWRRLDNGALHDLYSSPYAIRVIKTRRMREARHVACVGNGSSAYGALVGNPEGRRPLGRPRCRWWDNTKMHLQEE